MLHIIFYDSLTIISRLKKEFACLGLKVITPKINRIVQWVKLDFKYV